MDDKLNAQIHCNGKVRIYENFLSLEELKLLQDFVVTYPYDSLMQNTFKFWGKRLINKLQISISPGLEDSLKPVEFYMNLLRDRLINTLNKDIEPREWASSDFNFIKMYVDSSPTVWINSDKYEMFEHVDNQEHMEFPILWGSVIYLNDNYKGGEIYYSEHDFEYKPKAGALVLHEGNTKHAVKKVLEGDRYCSASLVYIKDFYNENPLPTTTNNPDEPYHYPPGYYGVRMPDDPKKSIVRVFRSNGTLAKFNDSPRLAKG